MSRISDLKTAIMFAMEFRKYQSDRKAYCAAAEASSPMLFGNVNMGHDMAGVFDDGRDDFLIHFAPMAISALAEGEGIPEAIKLARHWSADYQMATIIYAAHLMAVLAPG